MSYSPHDLFENRKQFQLERLILFSDAVFAIAITLLVIEIRVPVVPQDGNTGKYLADALVLKIHEYFGFVLSFVVIGQFWTNHHKLFGYVNNYNGKLLWLNLHLLFWIVLVPFTSGLNSHYGNLSIVWQVYSINLFMISMSIYFLYRYIGNAKNHLSDLSLDALTRKYSLYRSMATSLIFLSGALIVLIPGDIAFWIARFIYLLIFLIITLINKRFRRAVKKQQHRHLA